MLERVLVLVAALFASATISIPEAGEALVVYEKSASSTGV